MEVTIFFGQDSQDFMDLFYFLPSLIEGRKFHPASGKRRADLPLPNFDNLM